MWHILLLFFSSTIKPRSDSTGDSFWRGKSNTSGLNSECRNAYAPLLTIIIRAFAAELQSWVRQVGVGNIISLFSSRNLQGQMPKDLGENQISSCPSVGCDSTKENRAGLRAENHFFFLLCLNRSLHRLCLLR